MIGIMIYNLIVVPLTLKLSSLSALEVRRV